MDLVISNCVVNLSPDKRAVLREAHRALADGGELHFSDVYADRRLPAAVRADALLVNECLGVRALKSGCHMGVRDDSQLRERFFHDASLAVRRACCTCRTSCAWPPRRHAHTAAF